MTGSSEHHPPFAGRGAHVGTHQSKSIYPQSAGLSGGCAVELGKRTRMGECWLYGTPFWERKFVPSPLEFGVLLWAVTRARGMAVAAPRVPSMPWVAPKASALYPPGGGSLLAQSELYQEMLLHLALAGVRDFLFWHYGPDPCCWGALWGLMFLSMLAYSMMVRPMGPHLCRPYAPRDSC